MEDLTDDPREFAHPGNMAFDEGGLPPDIDAFLRACLPGSYAKLPTYRSVAVTLQSLMDRGMGARPSETVRINSENSVRLISNYALSNTNMIYAGK